MERDEIINEEIIKTLDSVSLETLKEETKNEDILTNSEYDRISRLSNTERKIPWGNHNDLKSEIPRIEEVYSLCEKLAKKDLKKGACLVVLYLTGGRIGEIVGRDFDDKSHWNGIRLRDIEYHESQEGDFVTIKTIIEKSKVNRGIIKTGKPYKILFKTAIIPVSDLYKPFFEILWLYLEDKKEESDLNQPVFPGVNYFNFYKYIKENIGGFGFHIFRHWRTTHLVQYHNFNEGELREYLGWDSKSSMPSVYTHSNKQIFLNKMRKTYNNI